MASKRRLPLLNATGDGPPDEPERPRWQWVGFGTLVIFAAWLPLSAIAAAVATRLLAHAPDGVGLRRAAHIAFVLYAAELALGAFAGGYLVGRWGAANVGVREAAIAGLASTVAVALVSLASFGLSFGPLLVACIAVPMAAGGARVGLRRSVRSR